MAFYIFDFRTLVAIEHYAELVPYIDMVYISSMDAQLLWTTCESNLYCKIRLLCRYSVTSIEEPLYATDTFKQWTNIFVPSIPSRRMTPHYIGQLFTAENNIGLTGFFCIFNVNFTSRGYFILYVQST